MLRIALLGACALISSAALADIGAGQWEMEVTTTMSGMAPTTARQSQCISAADAKDPGKLFGNPGGGCEFKNRQDSGSVYRFDIACAGATPLTGSGEVRYEQESMSGEIVLNLTAGPQPMETRSRIQARRTGPCTR